MPDGSSALEYHERTSHSPESIREQGYRLDWDNKPIPYIIYENMEQVLLPRRWRPPQLPTLRAIAETGVDPNMPDPTSATDSGSPDATDPNDPTNEPTLAELAQLCYYAAGITKRIERGERDVLFRAAACTGALYHVDLYLVTGTIDSAIEMESGGTEMKSTETGLTCEETGLTSDSLEPGVYHFDPRTLSLEVLREGDVRGVLSEAGGFHPAIERAPVTIVATSTWWRNAWKYRERTYRHAFWDSGTVLANLLAVASGLDLPASVITGFADAAVAELLGIDPSHTAPIALVPIGRGNPVPDAPALDPIEPETRRLSPREIEYELIQEAYAASSLLDGRAVREWRERRPDGHVTEASGAGDERIPLEPVSDARAAKTPIHGAVRRRGSCREFERSTVNGRKVATVLDRSTRGVAMDVRDPKTRLQYVEPYLIVHDVDGIPPGAYRYDVDRRHLEPLRSGEFRREAGHLALDQRLAADAALCVYFLADLEAVTDALGDRGYRVAQLEAAIAAGRLYLGTYAHRDIGGTGLTFYDDLVTEFFSPEAAGQTPMFLYALGRPA